ncbi:hypothetical protein HDU76_011100 [Blyttiomyces sp. JEL0837]|nr:hypothetical protein HDU76_011100 [Blyttiomyces sp. JEL0837]
MYGRLRAFRPELIGLEQVELHFDDDCIWKDDSAVAIDPFREMEEQTQYHQANELITPFLIHIPLRNLWLDMVPSSWIHDQTIKLFTLAASNNHIQLLRLLIQDLQDDDIDLWPYATVSIGVGHSKTKALSLACSSGHAGVVEYLLDEINNPTEFRADFPSFANACMDGHLEVAKTLNSRLPHIEPSAHENAAIIGAAERGNAEVVKYLLELNCVDVRLAGGTALLYACQYDYVNVVKVLLEIGGVNPAFDGNAAICVAASYGHANVVGYLLRVNGVDATVGDLKALRAAIVNDHLEVVKLLLGVVKIEAKQSTHVNEAWMFAVQNGFVEVVEYLLLTVENIDPGREDNLAIAYAADNGDVDMVKLLLGARGVNAGDDDNYALTVACERGHAEVVELLIRDRNVDPGAVT